LLGAFTAAKRQIRAAVRAVAVQQTPRARCVLEQHQILAEQLQGLDRANFHARVQRRVELVDQRGGLPVLAQQPAAGRARGDARQQFILFSIHGRGPCDGASAG
jgi:hypothetical protein